MWWQLMELLSLSLALVSWRWKHLLSILVNRSRHELLLWSVPRNFCVTKCALFITALRRLWNISHIKSLSMDSITTLFSCSRNWNCRITFQGMFLALCLVPCWLYSPLGKVCYRSLKQKWSLEILWFISLSLPCIFEDWDPESGGG